MRNLREPFYLVCGYGETGSTLVQALTERDQRVVTMDIKPERIALLRLENLREFVPALAADARSPANLLDAGLGHPLCAGVAALTNVNTTNLKIAITAKLLHPRLKVICRADSVAIEANMASFGTDHIYDPFDTFALSLATAIQAPQLTRLFEWLNGDSRPTPPASRPPPASGRWVLCGYGRFGKALHRHLAKQDLEVIIIEAHPERTGQPAGAKLIIGPGTEADTLIEAGITDAVGLVAGTDDDANNLSIIMTARDLNGALFVVARENFSENHCLFQAVQAEIIMHPSTIIAERIQLLLATPLLAELRALARQQGEDWAATLVERINNLILKESLVVWELTVVPEMAHALHAALADRDTEIPLAALLRNHQDRDTWLPVIPLLLTRNHQQELLPIPDLPLQHGDRLLFCGLPLARSRMAWTAQNPHALTYVMTGASRYEGWAWRKLGPWLARRAAGAHY